MKTPSKFYESSARKFCGDIEQAYPEFSHIRIVSNRGMLYHHGSRIFLSNAFNGCKIGLQYIDALNIADLFGAWRIRTIERINYLLAPNEWCIDANWHWDYRGEPQAYGIEIASDLQGR